MTLKFRPEDFTTMPAHIHAQHIFDTWLSEQQVVYGTCSEHLWHLNINCIKEVVHKARLVAIEEIKSKCEHEVLEVRSFLEGKLGLHNTYQVLNDTISWKCKHCGKELKPTSWSEV